jgi:hypothetical protein
MATPASRADLKDYCLRNIGFPVVDINVDDDQLEDRIDDALQLYSEFHFDGTEFTYLGVQLTANNISQKYVTVVDSIIGVSRVMPIGSAQIASTSSAGFNIFDINYQIRLNDFYNLLSSSYTYYVIAREHLAMLDMIVTGEQPLQFNKKTSQIHISMDWAGRLSAGDYLVFEAWRVINPVIYTKIFNDSWLKEYTTQLFKKQWGQNLKKYGNYILPGGIIINGQTIYDEAIAEVARLEEKLRDVFEEPPNFLVG